MPEDHHMLDALVFPRALFVTGQSQPGLAGKPVVLSSAVRRRQQVWDNFGLDNRFGYNNLGGTMVTAQPRAPSILRWAAYINTFLLQSNNIIKYPQFQTLDNDPSVHERVTTASGLRWWGTTNPLLGP